MFKKQTFSHNLGVPSRRKPPKWTFQSQLFERLILGARFFLKSADICIGVVQKGCSSASSYLIFRNFGITYAKTKLKVKSMN